MCFWHGGGADFSVKGSIMPTVHQLLSTHQHSDEISNWPVNITNHLAAERKRKWLQSQQHCFLDLLP